MDLILRNCHIFQNGEFKEGDIGVENEEIVHIGDLKGERATIEIDVNGRLVLPGVIDSHTHFGLQMMGEKSPDDFLKGTRGAIYGGVTTIIDFTEQAKGESLWTSFLRRRNEAQGKIWTDFSLHVNLTDFSHRWQEDVEGLISKGIKSFKFFTAYKKRGLMASDRELFEAFSYISSHGGMAMVHAENGDLVEFFTEKLINEGKIGPIYHARSRPNFVEAEAISRVIYIAEATNCPLYIVHVSTKEGLEEVRRGKERGVKIFAETCPQYLLLREEKLKGPHGIYYIATPPLRRKEDNEALWQGIFDGAIDVVSTDHAAYSKKQKEKGMGEFQKTPNGLPGVETLFSLIYTEGVLKRRLPIRRLVELLSINPSRIFDLSKKGKIEEGKDADLFVVDDEMEVTLDDKSLHGGVDFCPYQGFTVKGLPSLVVRRGEILLRDRKFRGKIPQGRFIQS